MRDIILKNSEWRRGFLEENYLLNTYLQEKGEPCRCCLGVAGKEFGVPDSAMADCASFVDYHIRAPRLEFGQFPDLEWLIKFDLIGIPHDSPECDCLVEINDDSSYESDSDRVRDLNIIANKHGINFIYREDL